MSPLARPIFTSPEAVVISASASARPRRPSPLAVCTVIGPHSAVAVMSPLAVCTLSAPSWPTTDTSADAVCASHADPAGALSVRSRPDRRRHRPSVRGPRTDRVPFSKLTLTWASRSSMSARGLLATTSTETASVCSPATPTLPAAQWVMLMAAGSVQGKFHVVIADSFGITGFVGEVALAAGEPGVALADRRPRLGRRAAARRRVQRPGHRADEPGVDGDAAPGRGRLGPGLEAFGHPQGDPGLARFVARVRRPRGGLGGCVLVQRD